MLNEGFGGHVEGAWKKDKEYAPDVHFSQLKIDGELSGAEAKKAKDRIAAIVVELTRSQLNLDARAALRAEGITLADSLPSGSERDRMRTALRNA